jgi:hypothetical protein
MYSRTNPPPPQRPLDDLPDVVLCCMFAYLRSLRRAKRYGGLIFRPRSSPDHVAAIEAMRDRGLARVRQLPTGYWMQLADRRRS